MITVPDIKPVSISPKMIMVHNDVMVGQIISYLLLSQKKVGRVNFDLANIYNNFDFHTKDQIGY